MQWIDIRFSEESLSKNEYIYFEFFEVCVLNFSLKEKTTRNIDNQNMAEILISLKPLAFEKRMDLILSFMNSSHSDETSLFKKLQFFNILVLVENTSFSCIQIGASFL